MRLSQKKNCTACKALYQERYTATCELGCKPKAGKTSYGIVIEYIPDKPCYKPLTNDLYFEAKNLIRASWVEG